MRSSRSISFVVAVGLGAVGGGLWSAHDAREAAAVGTRTFELDTQEKLSGGELKGTSVTAAGDVIAGWAVSKTTLSKGTVVWSALALKDGSVLLGVGNEGRVLKVDAGGKETVVAETGTLAVTALVEGPGGKIYAGTIPEGEIFVVDPNASVGTNPSAPSAPKPKAWSKVPADHIWALVYDQKRKELFAGTGPDGKIFRVDAAGKAQIFHQVEDGQVLSLAIAPSGTVYAGTSSKGLLVAISAPGKAEVVQDFDGHEVKAIGFAATPAAEAPKDPKKPAPKAAAPSDGDSLYCVVNEYGTVPEPFKKFGMPLKQPGASFDPPKGIKGKGQVWKISGLDKDGRNGKPERIYADTTTHYLSLAVVPAPKQGGPAVYVGSANDGKVVSIDDAHGSALVAKADSRSIGAIGLVGNGDKGSWFAGGDAGVFHRVTGVGGADATWTSKVLDAGLKARWGKLNWRTLGGAVELSTHTGPTATPDDSWSAWSNPLAAPGKATSPTNRYVQIRARWKGNGAAVLRGVSLAFVTDNLRAIVTEVSVPSKGSLTSGVVTSGADTPWKSGSLGLSWKTDNPDQDVLRYRLWYRKEESTVWRNITKDEEPLAGTSYSWNTEALAEGWYRVRVEASDEVSNPVGQALKHGLDSPPFLVDNTPPVITKIALANGRLQATVVDGVGPIVRLEVQIDGKAPWKPVASVDGILDEATEQVDAPLGLVGSHVVALRAYDSAGNAVTREIEGK